MTRLGLLVAGVLAAFPARASDLVLYADSDPATAIAQVAREAKADPSTLRASTLTALLHGRPPMLQGGGSIEVCARDPASKDDIAADIAEAESAMAYLEYDKALKSLDEAASLLGCLSIPADPQVAGRVYYLRGLVYYFSKEEQAAKKAWTQAHHLEPDLQWDDDFAPDGKPLFEQACKEADALPNRDLYLDPPLAPSSLWIDGRPADLLATILSPPDRGDYVSPSAGDHLVQYGTAEHVTTARIHLDAEADQTLLLPQAVTDDDLHWLSTGSDSRLIDLLAGTVDPDTRVYVVWDTRTWSWKAGEQSFTLLPPARHPTRYLAVTGFSVAGAALITSGITYARAKQLVADVPKTTSLTEYGTLATRYKRNKTVHRVATGVLVLGGVVGAVGIYIPLADDAGIVPGPQGLRLVIRR